MLKGRLPKFAAALTAAAFLTAFSSFAIASEKGHHPHWTYEGEHGPGHWGAMSKDFEACSKGKRQSPVDISGSEDSDLPDIGFSYKPSKLNIINNGHTIQVNYDKGSSIKVDGVDYQLLQFHFHDPSEHTVNGKSFENELHIVHKNEKGDLAVIGVLIEKGAENAAFNNIWANLPKKAEETKAVGAEVNAADLLPKEKTYYRYPGSLTTPPCTESVTWLVLKTPVQMSEAQLDAFKSIVGKNNRPVQPMHGRRIKADTVSH